MTRDPLLDPQFQHLPPPPLCSGNALTPAHRLRLAALKIAGRLYRSGPVTPATKILLIRPDHLGDLLFLTPALRHLRQQRPQTHLSLMIGPWSRHAIQNNPHPDQILTCEFPGFTRRPKESTLWPYRYLAEQARLLRQHRFDLAIILRFDHWWGAWLAAQAGIPQRIGYDIAEVRPFLTRALPYVDQRHEVEQNCRLVDFALGLAQTETPGPTEFFTAPAGEAWAAAWLSAAQVAPSEQLIIIHPGAGAEVKLWRVEAWAELAVALTRRPHRRIILSGGPDEVALCREIAGQISPAPLLVAGQTTLGQLAALMKKAALVIGPDTGPLKLAAAVGTPSLQLYGPVSAVKFGPWGDPLAHRYVAAGLSCLPCNRLDFAPAELADHFCVRGLSVAGILKEAEAILAR